MKVLGLLSSNVRGGDARIAQRDLFPARMAPALAERLGEPVDIVARFAWPTPALPQTVARWMAEEEPELVIFVVQAYWFLYESMPARLEQHLGRLGPAVASASFHVAATPWLAHNAVFRWSRKTLQRHFRGLPHFKVEEVIAMSGACIATMLQCEGAYVVVVGPAGGEEWPTDDAARTRMERRRKTVDDAVNAFCQSRHIEYWNAAMLAPFTERLSLQGDGLHLDAEGHRQHALRFLDMATGLCERARAQRGTAVHSAEHVESR